MTKAVVLFSGGQDSTTALYQALASGADVTAVSVWYGQRHQAELDAAQAVIGSIRPRVDHYVLNMEALQQLGDSALVTAVGPIGGAGGRPDTQMPEGLPTSFVPGRNAMLLTMAAAVAVKIGARQVVTGVCQTDYSGYPDCRREFVDALEKALTLAMPSSCGPIEILTPLMHLTKAETVKLARTLPGCWEALALTVTCYEGKRPGCGTCPACTLRARGFAEAGETDPAA